ncbi:6950_t:CDS:2, partial [Gigaspora rosea]
SKPFQFMENKKLILKPTFNQITESQAELVLSAGDAYFYLVGDIGVAQFTSMIFDNNQLREIQNGFQLLHEKNAKKLVLDLSNNAGGYVTTPPIISAFLLPSNSSSFFPNDQKITNITEQMIGPGKLFDPNELLSFPSRENFSSTEDFIGNNYIQRGGTTSRYSSKFNFKLDSDILKIMNGTKEYPWTKDNTIILTNGYCGSACALLSLYLSEIGQFSTVSVGGFYNTSLSFSSFPGGEVFSYCSSCNNNINGIPKFPVLAELSTTIIEAY